MVYEVSIPPNIAQNIESNHDIKVLKKLLKDVLDRGYIKNYQRGGWAETFRQHTEGENLGEVIDLFNRIQDEGRVVYAEREMEEGNEEGWAEEVATEEHGERRTPGLVVVSSDPNGRADRLEGVCNLEELCVSDYWRDLRPRSVTVKMTTEEYAGVLKHLLSPSSRAKVIDPHFDNQNSGFLESCMDYISIHKSNPSGEVHVHTSTAIAGQIDDIQRKQEKIEDTANSILRVANGRENVGDIKVWVWFYNSEGGRWARDESRVSNDFGRFQDLHDRYLVTQQHAVSLPWGAETFSGESPNYTKWSLLSKRAKKEVEYKFPTTKSKYEKRMKIRIYGNDPPKPEKSEVAVLYKVYE